MILEGFIDAIQLFVQPITLLAMLIGTIVGLIVGIIPGIGGTIGMALFLPFVFATPAEYVLPFMVALWGTTATSGAITSILLNVPGTAVNAATLLDGFPMTKKGEAGRAIGAAVTSSGLGGITTAIIALALIPLILPMIMTIQSADMVFMILLGLSFVAILSRGSMVKGLISGGVGMLIAYIGYEELLGTTRFTFHTLYLYDGIGLVPLVLGLFALPEMIRLAVKGGTITEAGVTQKMRGMWQGAKDVFRHWTLWLRCTVGGLIIGIIPGIGGAAATFMAYAHAKQSSKYPEKFGTGIVEGVIAPESANNAKDGGALLTTLALGIPGSSDLAILIGAFLLLGLVPGPKMLSENLGPSLSLLYVLIAANVIAAAICLMTARYLIKIVQIPTRLLAPTVIVIALVGAYSVRGVFHDVSLALVMTLVGLVMVRFGYNRASMLLGFVLGRLFEKYLRIAYGVGGALFFLRPISLTLLIIIIGAFTYGPIMGLIQRIRGVQVG